MVWSLKKHDNTETPDAGRYQQALIETPFPIDVQRAAEVEALRRRIADVDTRQAEIAARQRQLRANVTSYEMSELETEARDLDGMKSAARRRLTELTALPDPRAVEREQRRQALIAVTFSERRAGILRQIDRFEKAGEHRQARIWRREILGLREKIELEIY